MRQIWIKYTVAATAASLVGWSGAHADTVKIGVNQPLTGVVAAAGHHVVNGAKVAADLINAKGGINGNQIQLVIEDNKSNPTEAANVTEKLIVRDKVPVIMGAWSSTYTLASMPKLMEYKVPMVVETSSADKITISGNPYIFRISPTNGMEAMSFVKYVDPLKIRKADFLVVNNDWGLGAAVAFKKILQEKGRTVGKTEIMDASAQDMSAQLASLKSSDSDTLFITTGVEQMVLVLKQAQTLGLKRQIITTGGTVPDQLIEQAGSAADSTMHDVMFAPWYPEMSADPEAAKAFVAEWKKRGLNPVGMSEGARGYDGIITIAAAIAKAGKAEPEAIRNALWNVRINGLTGKVAFNKAGPQGKESGQSVPDTHIVRIENGKVIPVKF
jgi:branched-chain amino acid transport system substrate-binding protein